MTEREKSDKLYMAQVNLGGITGPMTLVYHKEYEPIDIDEAAGIKPMDCWWDETGNYSVPGPGRFHKSRCLIQFASYNLKEVRLFVNGAVALKDVLCNSVLSRIEDE